MKYTKPLEDLIEEFRKFPTIGPKSAQRMAFALLKKSPDQVEKFTRIIQDAKTQIKYCQQCFNLTANDNCEICLDPRRDHKQICVIETVKDLIALERTHEYRGLYHVLGGVISPLDGISADDINIHELISRVRSLLEPATLDEEPIIDLLRNRSEQGLRSSRNRSLLNVNEDSEDERNAAMGDFATSLIEIILGIGLSTEGEATMLYIKRLIDQILLQLKLNPSVIKVTRLAHGLPVGADLDYADEITLAKALEARVLA